MDAVEFLTSTVISGYAYDFLKQGFLITAKNVKDFFSNNLYEIPNEQARYISSNIQKIEPSDVHNLSREQFITKYENLFQIQNTSINNDNTTFNSTNTMANMGTQNINGDIYIGSPTQKKRS